MNVSPSYPHQAGAESSFDPMTWNAFKRRHCITVARAIYSSDTFTVRLLVALASGLYAFSMVVATMQGARLFEKPAYAIMAQAGNEWIWSAAFALHFFGVVWRILDPRERVLAGLAINFLGFVLWLYYTLCMNIALGYLAPSSSLEWTIIVFSGWALYRTGLKRELVTA